MSHSSLSKYASDMILLLDIVEMRNTGPDAGGVRGVGGVGRTAQLSGRGPRGCMCLHGAWALATLHGCSKRSGFGRVQVGPVTFRRL